MKRLDEDEQGSFKRYLGFIIATPIVIIAGFFILRHSPSESRPIEPRRTSTTIVIQNEPLPHPTPRQITPTPSTPLPDEKVVAAPLSEDNKPPAPPAPKPAETLLSTGIKGDDNTAGLAASGNGIGIGTFGGEPGGKGLATELALYARQVQDAVKDTLQNNPSTKTAKFGTIIVEVFPDPDGTIKRVMIKDGGRIDSALIEVIKKALIGSKISPPPKDFRSKNYKFIKINLSAPQ